MYIQVLSWTEQKGVQCIRSKRTWETSLKPTIYLNILKFWQHVEELPGKSIVACVAIVSVWFRRKERPRNRILGFGRSFAWAILTFVPRSLLLNRKETLATKAKNISKQCLMYETPGAFNILKNAFFR